MYFINHLVHMGIEKSNFNFSIRDISCTGHPISCKVSYIKDPKGLFWGNVCIIFLKFGKCQCLGCIFEKIIVLWQSSDLEI